MSPTPPRTEKNKKILKKKGRGSLCVNQDSTVCIQSFYTLDAIKYNDRIAEIDVHQFIHSLQVLGHIYLKLHFSLLTVKCLFLPFYNQLSLDPSLQ